jgi:hypothetical protein
MRRSPTICASVAIVKRILQVELGYKHKKIPADKSIKAYLSGDDINMSFDQITEISSSFGVRTFFMVTSQSFVSSR